MIHVIAEAERNIKGVIMGKIKYNAFPILDAELENPLIQEDLAESEVHTISKRHKVGIDCISLNDEDGTIVSAEDEYVSKETFFEIIRVLPTEREKFIALCLYNGFIKQEIAFMLKIHPSRVTRNTQEMRKFLSEFAKKARK